MAFAGRMRSTIPLASKLVSSESLATASRSNPQKALLSPIFTDSEISRNFSTATEKKEVKVKVPLALFGGCGNYASALYVAAVKTNALDKVEFELNDIVEATKQSPVFSQFTKDPSVPAKTRVGAIDDICIQAKFSDVTKNFLVTVAANGRLRYIDSIAKKFEELTMAHRGEVRAIVTTVIPIPPEEEKELKAALQDIIGHGKKVILEQKIDTSILGGLVVEFDRKVFDMSIKTRARQMERFLREPINIGNL
jgi:F-type H+-transporting ATPase subunit O